MSFDPLLFFLGLYLSVYCGNYGILTHVRPLFLSPPQTENGSALHEAALFGKTDVVRLLLHSGGSINVPCVCFCGFPCSF